MNTKHCRYCDRMLDVSRFTIRSASVDGLSYKCRECASSYAKTRYHSDSTVADEAKQRAKRWASRNPDKRLDVIRKFTERNLESERARKREYGIRVRKQRPDEVRLAGIVAAHTRRHREVSVDAFPHKAAVKRLISKANGKCTYCHGLFTSLTIDHFHPVSKGGGGQLWNLIPCCKPCNSSKGAKDGPDWIEKNFGVQRVVDVLRSLNALSQARLP